MLILRKTLLNICYKILCYKIVSLFIKSTIKEYCQVVYDLCMVSAYNLARQYHPHMDHFLLE